MKIDLDKIVPYIKEIGPSTFALYCYLLSKTNGEWTWFKTLDIMNDLLFSKPSTIEKIRKLRELKLVKRQFRIEDNKKKMYLKTTPGSFPLPSSSSVYILNSNNTKETIGNKDKGENTRFKKIYKYIIEQVLSHRRYDNPYYRDRNWKFKDKDREYIEKLDNNIKDIKGYVAWWLKEKAGRMPGFSIGLMLCYPMIEEYKIKNKIPLSYNKEFEKDKHNKNNKKALEFKKEMIKSVIHDMKTKEDYVLTKLDKEFLEESIEEGLVKKDGDRYIATF